MDTDGVSNASCSFRKNVSQPREPRCRDYELSCQVPCEVQGFAVSRQYAPMMVKKVTGKKLCGVESVE
jgi:hypothetical protein